MNGRPSEHAGDRRAQRSVSGFLAELRRDTAGNTLAIMGAFVIPLAGLAGSAVDMSRLYLVKARLQQACDAGVLAGRKVMTVTSGTLLDATAYSAANPSATPAHTAAKSLFDNNFPTGWMSTTNATFTPNRTSDSQVTATATVSVPMAIMGMFGVGATTQTVTCTARLDIGDSDIMFVLDVTGSMACSTGSGCSSTSTWTRADGTTGYYIVEQTGSKIASLRSAVKLFRTTLESNKPAAAHIRYGFVPYSSSVNVGALITGNGPTVTGKTDPGKPEYIASTASYPSRELADDINSSTLPTDSNTANYNVTGTSVRGRYYEGDMIYAANTNAVTGVAVTAASKAACLASDIRTTGSGSSTVTYAKGTFPTSSATTLTRKFPVWTPASGSGSSATPASCMTYAYSVKPYWRYTDVAFNTATFKTFATGVADPSKFDGSTMKWQGCIEERNTVVSTTSTTYSSTSLPKDMDPDYVPDSDATRWRPLWPNVVYYRAGTGATLDSNGNSAASSDTASTGAGVALTPLLQSATGGSLGPTTQYYGCSAPARRLAEMSSTDFDSYLGTATTGDFRGYGHTFHDVGMIWGLRLISPDGIWKNDTAAWAGNNPPNRYIVFMTDGDMDPEANSYALYGLNKVEAGAAAANTSKANLETIHGKRFQAICQAAKDKNITVFVVQFDNGSTPSTDMSSCATPGFAYAAQNDTQLASAFSTIALQIARLRLSQ